VWNREVEFAKAVQDHDTRAFAEHVHLGAVFVEGDAASDVKRGRDAIADAWKGLLHGDAIRLDWHPTSVILTGDPHVALSRGPYWMEDVRPNAKQRFLTGLYQSVWVQDADGAWRVAIDGGTAAPVPASAEDVQKIRASVPERCPGDSSTTSSAHG
jgi:ketosteroid isomerase-like protein